ncbi:hypothetical protein NDU88_004607 [Pleurodeles waltl]|uniref:Uncharacterized protein n=1 Tax=Pleurodeles waltl TaxID=8319 RepID=A0AAV7T7W7_PLEWA|nr:hypothetical protein NDU88_004607 [Pleurodeles waltl]
MKPSLLKPRPPEESEEPSDPPARQGGAALSAWGSPRSKWRTTGDRRKREGCCRRSRWPVRLMREPAKKRAGLVSRGLAVR